MFEVLKAITLMIYAEVAHVSYTYRTHVAYMSHTCCKHIANTSYTTSYIDWAGRRLSPRLSNQHDDVNNVVIQHAIRKIPSNKRYFPYISLKRADVVLQSKKNIVIGVKRINIRLQAFPGI